MKKTLWFASENRDKIKEMSAIFAPYNIELKSALDIEGYVAPEETGSTFQENAIIKAQALYDVVQMPTIADDSGMAVDKLDGRPGVYSARYGSENQTGLEKVLVEMKDETDRVAQFVCCIAFIAGNAVTTFDGILEGTITREKQGEHGFGYDPIFFLPTLNKTMAELNDEEKNAISHRAIAINELINSDAFSAFKQTEE